MKYLFTLLLTSIFLFVNGQPISLKVDESLPIPKLNFDENGTLMIVPSATSSSHDFDFLVGKWKLKHRKLKSRLNGSNEWEEFETVVEDFTILEGNGNMDIGHATRDGKPWEGRTIRLFNPNTRLWSLHWIASNINTMDPAVVGSFENGVGHFFGQDIFNGKKIIVMFRWDARDKEHAKWSQAFSPDNGKTWEWNWFNVKERVPELSLKEIQERNVLIPIPKLNFDENGELVIVPSSTSSQRDFDYLIGGWTLKNRKLKSRLTNSKEWEEFETDVIDFNILEGKANMDVCDATIDGKPWQGRTIRLFNPTTKLWSLYWIASNAQVMDPPVVGSFENGIGHFFCKDTFNGKKVIVLFRWDKRDANYPVWSQAFSPDNGKTWEWNFMNVSHRKK